VAGANPQAFMQEDDGSRFIMFFFLLSSSVTWKISLQYFKRIGFIRYVQENYRKTQIIHGESSIKIG